MINISPKKIQSKHIEKWQEIKKLKTFSVF